MKKILYLFLLIIPFLTTSCNLKKNNAKYQEGDTLHLKYAKNIIIVRYGGYSVVKLINPWNRGKILHTYILINKGGNVPTSYDTEATKINIPVSRCVISTSVHCELAKMLNKENSIIGICDVDYIKSKWLINKIKNETAINCGNSLSPNIEKIIAIKPDAIFLSPMQNTGGYGKVETLGIPIIELADYMEPTALGRAEWIKFYALLLGAEEKGEKIFKQTEQNYIRLKQVAAKSKTRPRVIMDKIESGIWYQPGGKSTIAQLLDDAATKYIYSYNNSAGSLQLSKENVLYSGANANIWILRYFKTGNSALSLKELALEDKGYTLLKAYREGNVYGCNTNATTFFEDVPFRPDLLLRDFIILAHPELKQLGMPKYFQKLK